MLASVHAPNISSECSLFSTVTAYSVVLPALECVHFADQFDQWSEWGLWQQSRNAAGPWWLLGAGVMMYSPSRWAVFRWMEPWNHTETVFSIIYRKRPTNSVFTYGASAYWSLTPWGAHIGVAVSCHGACVALWMSGWAGSGAWCVPDRSVVVLPQAPTVHRVRVCGQRGWACMSLGLKGKMTVNMNLLNRMMKSE